MKHVSIGVGINLIQRIDRVRDLVDKLGFRMGHAPHHSGDDFDSLALYPRDE